MVNLLEELALSRPSLKDVKATLNPKGEYVLSGQQVIAYSCDCDGFGGGEPSCDNS